MELIKATLADWEFLLFLRNDAETRRNSINTEAILPEQHLTWLQNVLLDEHVHLFIAMHEGSRIGTARANYDPSLGIYYLSWTISPESRGKGFGKLMVLALASKFEGKIRAEIKKGNLSSIRIAEYAGMRFEKEENDVLVYSR